MKCCIDKLIFFVLLLFSVAPGGAARSVTDEEATVVASNWVQARVQATGNWNGSAAPTVGGFQPLIEDEIVVGYFASIQPSGFIYINARTELFPIKAFSETDSVDPDCSDSAIVLFREAMKHSVTYLTGVADSLGVDALTSDVVETSGPQVWSSLLQGNLDLIEPTAKGLSRGDYVEGEFLLEDSWNQCPPYNDRCPDMACDWGSFFPSSGTAWEDSEFFNENAWAGCVAVSGSQVMRYWGWPPRGVGEPFSDGWDWANMRDLYRWKYVLFDGYKFVDENSEPISGAQVDAVAELMREVGIAVDMSYGCDGSSAYVFGPINTLQTALQDKFRFHDGIAVAPRITFFDWEWWNLLVGQLDKNRPLPYYFEGHAFTVDGYDQIGEDGMIHVNYGHGPSATCDGHLKNFWYWLTSDICGHEPWEQGALVYVRPNVSLGSAIGGYYTTNGSFQWRYFDRDAISSGASFEPGQFLQFHNHGKLECLGSHSDTVRFEGLGTTVSKTYLYTRGDRSRGIKLQQGGVLMLRGGGGLQFF